MISNYGLLFLVLGLGMGLSVALKKLNLAGALCGGLLGLAIYAGAGFTGIAMMATFFLAGTAATHYKRDWKEALGITDKKQLKRTASQVLANGGVAGILGVMALFLPGNAPVIQVMIAAAFAAATADTLSSELGIVFGKTVYNIRSLKRETPGMDGAISWEGTFAGIAGSILIAMIYSLGYGLNQMFIWIITAGIFGNLADSYLGATLERSQRINNDVVNFLNTLAGALLAFVLATFFK